MTEADWRYANHAEYENLKQEAKKLDAQLIVRPDQLKLWKGEIPYPEEGRNTEQKEKEYGKDINERLHGSEVANLHLEITLHRRDSLIWTDSEKESFIADLIDKLSSIERGELPRNWHKDIEVVYGNYTQRRENGYRIQNDIEIRESKGPLKLILKPNPYLGVNWRSVEGVCSEAQRQIRGRLKREAVQKDFFRLVIILLTIDLVDRYYPEVDKLINEVKRRLFDKHPDISAIAFCEVSDLTKDETISLGRFLVFHIDNKGIPVLPVYVFEGDSNFQLNLLDYLENQKS